IAADWKDGGNAGIAPDVTLLVIKAECNDLGQFARTSDLVFGLYYAIEQGADVVNMSFGSSGDAFSDALALAYDSDIICVAAAGNDSTSVMTYPAASPLAIGVGALDEGWSLAWYSNYGENVDIVAPGTALTTAIGGGYKSSMGTSIAAPMVSGLIALYLSDPSNTYATFDEVEELLYASSYDLGDLGPDWHYGYGAVDASAFLVEERGTITFDMMCDEVYDIEQLFICGHTLQNIPEPERLYSVFDGWYYDEHCTEEFQYFTDVFTSDITLYAHWVNEDDGLPYTYVILDDGTVEIRSYTGHRKFITIPDYIDGRVVSSIGEFAFSGESKLRQINLPVGLEKIKESAFSGCSNLMSITIPDGVTVIGVRAFEDNIRLSNVNLGLDSKLQTIGDHAFHNCQKLTGFDVNESVTSIGAGAFLGCIGLMSIDVVESNLHYSSVDGVLYNESKDTLIVYPAGRTAEFSIPEYVDIVGDYAFAYSKIKDVRFTNVSILGNSSFMHSQLRSVDILDTITYVGRDAFSGCTYLSSATIGSGISKISDDMFSLTGLRSIQIPNTILSIGLGAFSMCLSLEEISFESNSSLIEIGSSAFSFNISLESVELPSSVEVIGAYAFSNCLSLNFVSFDTNSVLSVIGPSSFEYVPIRNLSFPDSVSTIGEY
ncbi:MAG: leucine-rich repeat protein, partial [Candidatus Methanomethylophilaceae archaeon]|nr:leucine-rich repeat protein [Candidatus Methanomethylophilaceae archaeon]